MRQEAYNGYSSVARTLAAADPGQRLFVAHGIESSTSHPIGAKGKLVAPSGRSHWAQTFSRQEGAAAPSCNR
jgi:hypothetical protein